MPFNPWTRVPDSRQNEISIEGARIRWVEKGDRGPVVLLLHGFPQTSACWARVMARWKTPSRVLAVDLPGFGASDPPADGDYSFAAQSRRLIGLLNALKVERATWVGHDLGGGVVYMAALRNPERVAKMVIVNSPFRSVDLRRAFHFFLFGIPGLSHALLTVATERIVSLALWAGVKRQPWDDGEPAYYEALYDTPDGRKAIRETYRNVLRAMTRPKRRTPNHGGEAVRRFPPALVIWGANDPVLPSWVGEDVEAALGAQLILIPGIGHFVPDEAPGVLATAIEGFVQAE